MIQFNLLPDVKLQYIKARRTKRLAITTSLIAASASFMIFILLFIGVTVVQKGHMKNLNADIQRYSNQLRNTPDLNKILTVQHQLESLPTLHNQKVAGSRIFRYVGQVTPVNATLSKLKVDFELLTITLEGDADSLSTVNKFVDTLKFTTFNTADGLTSGDAFKEVVLTNFSIDDSLVSYEISMKFEQQIFNNAQDVNLTIPKIISTRSETEKPAILFQDNDSEESQ